VKDCGNIHVLEVRCFTPMEWFVSMWLVLLTNTTVFFQLDLSIA